MRTIDGVALVLLCCGTPSSDLSRVQSQLASGVTRYEAEAAQTNLPTETRWPGYSGSAYLCCWNANGQQATFTVNAAAGGSYRLSFGYSAGNGAASRVLTVNGAASTLAMPGTADWNTWCTAQVTVTLNGGNNTVTLGFASGSSNYVNLDYLDVSATGGGTGGGSGGGATSGRLEAEQSQTNLPTETRWPGFSGPSYLCCWDANGQYATFTVNAAAAGFYTLTFGYSAGNGNATRTLTINGAGMGLTLLGTADWNTWGRASTTAALQAGSNTVTLSFGSGSSNYVNLDYLDYAAGGGGSGGTTIDDTDSSIIYSSIGGAAAQWGYGTGDSSDSAGDEHYSGYCQTSGNPAVGGPMAVENFNGTAITLLGARGNNFGIGAWSLDGAPLQTVDAYDPSVKLHQQALVSVAGLAPGSHVLAFQQTCAKNAGSSNVYQVIDGYQISGAPLALSSASVANKSNGRAAFSGSGWTCGSSSATNLGGVHCWDGTAGDAVSWTFTGSLIELFGRPDTGDGLFDVYIDGARVAQNVDGHYGTVDDDALTAYMLWSAKLSSGGTHTIKVVVNGTEDSNNGSEASGLRNLVQFDEFVAFP